ncbi:hypothetical protein WJX72_008325 [[Myrmecia] bisecta]|uniref:FAD-binding FR-type domain-containing protein n=1 Tax=[Myrmecia] bisecta TaxID=41462 RepID=A0AAW1P4X7_9CHLO
MEIHTSPSQRTWTPHIDSWTELPIKPLRRLPPRYYSWRWQLWRPFRYRLLSGRCSLGALLMVLVISAATVGFCVATWNNVTGSGNPPAILLLLTWTLAAHSSIWTLLMGLPFERAIGWHQFTVWLALASGVYHGVVAERGWWKPQADGQGGPQANSQGGRGTQGDRQHLVTGWILFGLICGMVATSLPPIRRRLWNAFYYTHVLLSLVIIVVGIVHSASLILGGVALWAIDVLYRRFYVAGHACPQEATIQRLDADVVRVSFPKTDTFEYSGGQYVFLQVPGVSRLEWHPFSISSHPQSDTVMLHVRALGDWTRKLLKVAPAATEAPQQIRVHIEGPYGSPQMDLSTPRYQIFLLVSGGIGITPMQSTVNDLLAQQQQGRPIKKIWFIWSVRDRAMISHFMQGHSPKRKAGPPPTRLPRSFVPDLVTEDVESMQPPPEVADPADAAASSTILQAQYHLTQVRDAAQFDEAGIRPEEQPNVTFGRPNLPELFAKISAMAQELGEKHVATLSSPSCHPESSPSSSSFPLRSRPPLSAACLGTAVHLLHKQEGGVLGTSLPASKCRTSP